MQAALNNSRDGGSSSRISDLEDSGKLKNPPPLPRPPTSPDKVSSRKYCMVCCAVLRAKMLLLGCVNSSPRLEGARTRDHAT